MAWQIALGFFLILSASSNLFRRTLAKDYPGNPIVSMTMMYLFAVVPLGIVGAFLIGEPSLSNISHARWLQLIAGGFIYSSGFIFALKANEKLDAAQYGLIATLGTPTAIFGTTLFLRQGLNFWQGFGVVLIIVGSILVVSTTFSKSTLKPSKATGIGILSAVLLGVGFVNESDLIDQVGLSSYLIVGWGSKLVAFLIISNRRSFAIPNLVKQPSFKYLLGAAITLGLSRLCLGFAINQTNPSVVTGVSAYQSAATVLGSIVILKERTYLGTKIVATFVATLGLLLVAI